MDRLEYGVYIDNNTLISFQVPQLHVQHCYTLLLWQPQEEFDNHRSALMDLLEI